MIRPSLFLLLARWRTIQWLLPTLVGAALLYARLDKGLFQYDEADYVTAARQGFIANYLDTTVIPTREFLTKGARDVFLGEHGALSKAIRERRDVSFYRHYHPPLMFYLLALAGRVLGTSDMTFRLMGWLTAVLIIPTVYWSLHIMCGSARQWTGSLAALLVAVSPMLHTASESISVHSLYIVIALLTIAMQVRYFHTQRLRDFYLFICVLALAFVVNEYALFLLCVCSLSALLIPNALLSFERNTMTINIHLLGGIVLCALVATLVWPGGLLKLSAMRSYIYLTYLVLIKGPLSYGSQSVADVWRSRFIADPVEALLIVLGLGFGLYGLVSKKLERNLLPLLLYPTAIFCANLLNRAAFPTYALSMYPFLLILASMGIVSWVQRRTKTTSQYQAAALVVLGVCVGNLTLERLTRREDLSPFRTGLNVLKAEAHRDDRVLVNFGYLPTVSYYLPGFDVSTIYLEDRPEDIATKFDQRFYRYFLFFGTEWEFQAASYRASLAMNYREVRRIPNRQDKVLILFTSR